MSLLMQANRIGRYIQITWDLQRRLAYNWARNRNFLIKGTQKVKRKEKKKKKATQPDYTGLTVYS